MQNKNDIDKIIDKTFEHIKDIVDANTVVGEVLKLSESIYVLPVSKISVGLVSGGGSMPDKKKKNVNMGSGTGFNIVPVGFITINNSIINFLPVNAIDDMSKNILDGMFKIYEHLSQKSEMLGEEKNEEN